MSEWPGGLVFSGDSDYAPPHSSSGLGVWILCWFADVEEAEIGDCCLRLFVFVRGKTVGNLIAGLEIWGRSSIG